MRQNRSLTKMHLADAPRGSTFAMRRGLHSIAHHGRSSIRALSEIVRTEQLNLQCIVQLTSRICEAPAPELSSRDAYRSGHVVYLGYRDQRLRTPMMCAVAYTLYEERACDSPLIRLSAAKKFCCKWHGKRKNGRLWLGRRGVPSPMEHWWRLGLRKHEVERDETVEK